MDAINDEVGRLRAAAYWGRYQWLQGLWRMGERLTLGRWGRIPVDGGQLAVVSMEGERDMRHLGQGLEALLVGFEGFEVRAMDDVVVELGQEEREILVWLARGYDVAGIAERTAYSASWIYQRLRGMREAMGVRTDVGVVIEGLRWGLIGLPGEGEMWR